MLQGHKSMVRPLPISKLNSRPRTRAPQRRSTATWPAPLTPRMSSSCSMLWQMSSSPTTSGVVASIRGHLSVFWSKWFHLLIFYCQNMEPASNIKFGLWFENTSKWNHQCLVKSNSGWWQQPHKTMQKIYIGHKNYFIKLTLSNISISWQKW